ncbi:DUF2635 domain-containing protein [Acetobacter oeni]|uniref:Uncharacterized protein n=1 Tax=Acetobacter oeni TaxID=304077 RepID=A0A511XP16_9PROT|nr:DUF2635 domain-containing protein [Acetobacter oeni]MBB3884489.1 hypothetical protein [Acetobacter oeni]NHO20421.1 DUF2635 domain-containing protein [Acetobacter oeni]GBR00535.1 hypothetical protein AA21952_0135 [Acetobacter oeni LMG 21952]GEN64700.1 hypothetical protein AOE01nite_29240 [Acetobacter oeni]
MITLKPREGLKIRDCMTRELIPATGINVEEVAGRPRSPYWQRLLRDGDVTTAAPQPAHAAALISPPSASPQE